MYGVCKAAHSWLAVRFFFSFNILLAGGEMYGRPADSMLTLEGSFRSLTVFYAFLMMSAVS